MRIILILLVFIAYLPKAYTAERGPDDARSSPSSAAEERPARPYTKRPEEQAPAPVISTVSSYCVRPGDILNFTGNKLSAFMAYRLAVVLDNRQIILKRLSAENNRLVYQLPNDKGLKENHRYKISVLQPNNSNIYQQTELSILICRLLQNDNSPSSTIEYEPGEILVLLPQPKAKLIHQEILNTGYDVVRYHELLGLGRTLFVIKVDEQEIEEVLISLRKKYPDAVIDKNSHYKPMANPRTYAPKMISWPNNSACNDNTHKKITIGIIDSYIDKAQPALENQNITIKNFLNKTDAPDKQHGTSIAVILTGDKPELGYQGLLSGVKIMAASAVRKENSDLIATTEGLVRSLDWLTVNKVRLINISLSGTNENFILKNAFHQGIQKGLIIFAAAGNEGKNAKSAYPAALPGVIAITAVDAVSKVYINANQGDYIDFSAPGVDIWTVDDGTQGKYRSGTSFAAPYALATAALYIEQNPSLSLSVLYNAMKKNVTDLGEPGHDTIFGWGLVQAPHLSCH